MKPSTSTCVIVFIEWLMAKLRGWFYQHPLRSPLPTHHIGLLTPFITLNDAIHLNDMKMKVWAVSAHKALFVYKMTNTEIQLDNDIDAAFEKLTEEGNKRGI